jgi:hypothetical protein
MPYKMGMYQNVRLSKHFVLLDFMYGRMVYTSRRRFPFASSVTDENIRTGRHLCETLLEPCIAGWGPCSVSFGLVPEPLAGETMAEYRPRPHKWVDRFGAAADLCFHDQCHDDVAPIDLCHTLDRSDNIAYERLITYGGSEYLCMGTVASEPRFALYENVRRPGQKAQFKTWGKDENGWRYRRLCNCPDHTTDWMREPGERSHAFPLDAPHHIRVGRYFVFLDFCRNEKAFDHGWNQVPKAGGHEERVARMFAEALDPLVAAIGRISVTHGGFWPTKQPTYQLAFLLPQDHPEEVPFDHPSIEGVEFKDHASGTTSVRLTIKDFEPKYTARIGGFDPL